MATQAQPQHSTQIISNGSKWAGQAPDPIELLLERLSQYPLDPVFLCNRGEGTPYQNATEGSDLVTFAGNFTTFSGVFRIVTNDPALVAELTARIEANETVIAWRAEHAGPKKAYYGTFSAIRDRHKAAAAAAPGVDIPGLYELAERAHSGTSFSPEKRAEYYTVSYKADLAADLGKIHAAGQAAGADAERTQAAADRYQAGYVAKLTAWLSAKGRCISTMITGASNFPVRRAEKANSSEHNRMNEFSEYCEKNLARAIKSLSTPPTAEELAAKYTREAEQLEKNQELMKAVNKIIRAAKGADCTEQIMAAGMSEKLAREIQQPDFANRVGFAQYMLTNNLANIKRVRARAAEETAKAQAQQQAAEQGQPEARPFVLNEQAGEALLNLEADRVQLYFEGRPDAATIAQLKQNGFKWAPSVGAWQRQNTENGRWAVQRLTGVDLSKPAPVATVEPEAIEQPAAVEVASIEPAQAPVATVEPEAVATCTSLEPAAVAEAVELEIDFNRLILLAGYHGPATADQASRLPDWHELNAEQLARLDQAAQRKARNGSPVTPANQAMVTARALAGKLTDAQRAELKWVGFDVPAHVSTYKPTPWTPRPAPAPEPGDVVRLEAGAAGPATSAQVYELAPFNALRLAYDTTPRTEARNPATIYAAGRRWRVSGNVWERWAGMTDRQAANSGRRARLEAERTEKANQALVAKAEKAGPLTALFYGLPELKTARYTTAEEAQAHEMKRRQAGHDEHRSYRAKSILKIRAKLATYSQAEVARLYTDWQRRTGGHGLEYLLDMFTQYDRAQAKARAQEPVATAPEPEAIGPATPTQGEAERSAPAAPGWHVIARPEHVAPEHLAQLAQLRATVQALPVPGHAPTLYEVVQLSQQLPPGSPFHIEARPNGLAIGYGAAEVLRLAPAGEWPAPSSNRTATRSAPPGTGYVPPKVAPIRPASRAQVRLLPGGGLQIYLPK